MARVAVQLTNFTGGELSPRLDGRNDLAKYSNDDLADARKNKGLSLESLAAYLDISKSYLCKMGRGQKPLSDKAIHFIKEGIIFPKNPKKSLNTMSRTGK